MNERDSNESHESDDLNNLKPLSQSSNFHPSTVPREQESSDNHSIYEKHNNLNDRDLSIWSNSHYNKDSSTCCQRPSFIRGDINIDPKKCQGFFSRGSITFTASSRPGEPSRVSIEYDEEMRKLIKSIVRKKSRYNFIFLRRSVGIAEEHFG